MKGCSFRYGAFFIYIIDMINNQAAYYLQLNVAMLLAQPVQEFIKVHNAAQLLITFIRQ